MTTDCSLNYKFNLHENPKLKPGENMLSTEIVSDIQNNFCAQHVLVLLMFCKKKSFWQRFTCTQLLIKKLINFPDYIFSVFSFLGQISARICLHQPLQGVYSGREPYRLHGHFLRIWSHVMSTGTFQSLDYRRPNTLALKPTDVSFFWSKNRKCTKSSLGNILLQ